MAVDPLGLTLAAMGIVSYITDTIAIDGDNAEDLRALREEVHGLAPILEKLQQRAEQLRSPEALRHLKALNAQLHKVLGVVNDMQLPAAQPLVKRVYRFLTARDIQGRLAKAQAGLNLAVTQLLALAHIEVAWEHLDLTARGLSHLADHATRQTEQLNKVLLAVCAVQETIRRGDCALPHEAAVELERLGFAAGGGGSCGDSDGSKNKQFKQIEAPPVDRPKPFPAAGDDECSSEFESLLEELTAAAKSASFSVKRESPAAAAPAGQELATPTAAQEPAQPSTICCICFDQPTDPCFVDDRAVTADLYCFVCLDRWMRVSSNDFTRARASTMLRRAQGAWISATYNEGYSVRIDSYLATWPKQPVESPEKSSLDTAQQLMRTGKALYGRGNHAAAHGQYLVAYAALQALAVKGGDQTEEGAAMRSACLSTLARCCVKLRRWEECTTHCSAALDADPEDYQAWRRRGQALLYCNNPAEAVHDLTEALQLVSANEQEAVCCELARAEAQLEKARFV